MFAPLKLNSSPAFQYFLLRYNEINDSDVIREAAYMKKGKKVQIGTEHSCYWTLCLCQVQRKELWFDQTHFEQKVHDPPYSKKNRLNVHYEHNSKSQVKIFVDLVEKELNSIYRSNKK